MLPKPPLAAPGEAPPLPPEPEPAAAAEKLAIRQALAKDDVPAARQLLAQALQRFPADPQLRSAHERLTLRVPDEKALAVLDKTLAEGTRLFGRQWLPGRIMPEDETEVTLHLAHRTSRNSAAGVNVALVKGYALLDRADSAGAERVLSRAIAKHGDSAALHYARVMARGMAGDYNGADADSLKAVVLSKEQAATLSQRALLMMRMGRPKEAFAWANRALEANPRDADALELRARVLCQERGRWDLALKDLERAAEIDPQGYGELLRYVRRETLRKRAIDGATGEGFKQALEAAELLLRDDPTDYAAHLARATVFLHTGKVEETIKESTLALKADPSQKWALLLRAKAMETLGQRGRAIADMRRAAALDPARFGPMLARLLQAHREGLPPLWERAGARTP